ncbi:DsbA family protein [Myxococcota bacterium]
MSAKKHVSGKQSDGWVPFALLGITVAAVAGYWVGGRQQRMALPPPPSVSAEAEGGACQDYAEKFCEKAGEQSSTCKSLQAVTEVMSPNACSAGIADLHFSEQKLAALGAKCDELVTKLCDAVGSQTESCSMVKKQTKQFPPDRCASMLKRVPDIAKRLKEREKKNQPLSNEQQATIAGGSPPSFGPSDAKVTIVEFSDFQCPHCARVAKVAKQVKQEYAGRVRFVFRQFPLSFHKEAHLAAQAALAANAQGKFWEYHDALFEKSKDLKREALERRAQEVGLNLAQLKAALDDKTYAAKVDQDMELGKKVWVSGTPSMFVNGVRVSNPGSFDAVKKAIEAAFANK